MECKEIEGPGSDGRIVSEMIRERKDCRMKCPTTEVLGESSLKAATPSRNKAEKNKNTCPLREF